MSPRITLVLPGPLRRLVGAGELTLDAATVADALAVATARHPALGGRITDARGALRPFVKVFVDGREAALDTPLPEGAELVVAPALSGG